MSYKIIQSIKHKRSQVMTSALVNKVKMNSTKLNVYRKVLQEACELGTPYIGNKVNSKSHLHNTFL